MNYAASPEHPSPDAGPFVRTSLPATACAQTTDAVLARAALIVPDLEAVVCGEDRITYRDLAARVSRASRTLLQLGVRPGDHVALCAGNGSEWVAMFYAITGLGAVVVAVNTRYRDDEFAHLLRQSRSRFLLTQARVQSNDILDMLERINAPVSTSPPTNELPDLERVVVLDDAGANHDRDSELTSWAQLSDLAETAPGEEVVAPAPDDIALIQYTSGTTSRPKGVLLTHRNMCSNAYFSGIRMGLRAGDRFHSVRPFFHVAGSTLSVLSNAQCLSTLVTMPRFDAGLALEMMEQERCTHFSGNDTIALMLLDHPDASRRTLSLRGAWVAASSAVVRRVISELGAVEAVVGYGQSEASPNVAQSAWYEPEEIRVAAWMMPQPGVDVRIWDGDTEAPLGTSGEIQVRGWNVMRGYFDDPERTQEACTSDGWLRTGDLGEMDEAGRVFFSGRLKELIRVGGENVAPAEIEEALMAHPQVQRAVVVGIDDPRLVEVPFAFVVLHQPTDSGADADQLLEWLRPRISGFKVPRHLRVIASIEELGMTASSKIQKGKVSELASALAAQEAQ